MNNLTRKLATVVAAASVGSGFVALSAPAAFADGKSTLGCSQPYTLASIATLDQMSQPLVQAGFYTEDSLMALLVSLDHNGDSMLCYKVPSGWYGPAATNGASRQGFVNLVDDKVISS